MTKRQSQVLQAIRDLSRSGFNPSLNEIAAHSVGAGGNRGALPAIRGAEPWSCWRLWLPHPKPFTPRIVATNAPKPSGGRSQAYAKAILANEVRAISSLTSGRNWALYCAGAKLGKFITAGNLSESKVVSDLMSASEANGYSQAKGRKQAEASIKSGLTKGAGDTIH
jgi:hypothetical protein